MRFGDSILRKRHSAFPLLFWSVPFFLLALIIYWVAVVLGTVRHLFRSPELLEFISEMMLWYSGVPAAIAASFAFVDLFVLLPSKRRVSGIRYSPVANQLMTVALTAYNDEESIAETVHDFAQHRLVRRVIVVDNNSNDETSLRAEKAGATVIREPSQGYGRSCLCALTAAARCEDTELTVLCEGDRTFRADDLDKFLAYLPHADFVCGTRICEQLRERVTQLTTFMYYGNFCLGKLLELKHLGRGTFSDVGTTYKLCRNDALRRLLPFLDGNVNLEFNAYFLDQALAADVDIVECPVTFHRRVGDSKGGNVDNIRAMRVGIAMIHGLYFGWMR